MILKTSLHRESVTDANVFAIQWAIQGGFTAGQALSVAEIADSAPLGDSPAHGYRHWLAVQGIGLAIIDAFGDELKGEAREFARQVVSVFALFHDLCREDEGHCTQHGAAAMLYISNNAPELVEKLEVSRDVLAYAAFAALCHTIVDLADESLILRLGSTGPNNVPLREYDLRVLGICLDADRLDLPRVGIQPRRPYLFTNPAKKYATENATY